MIRTTLCTLALILTASAGLACQAHTQQTQSCAEGTSWNSETHSCEKIINS